MFVGTWKKTGETFMNQKPLRGVKKVRVYVTCSYFGFVWSHRITAHFLEKVCRWHIQPLCRTWLVPWKAEILVCWICFWLGERLHGRRHKSIRIEWTWERIKWLPTYVLPPSTNSFFSHFWIPWRAFPITAAPQGWTIYNARVDHSYNSRVGNHREGGTCILKWG